MNKKKNKDPSAGKIRILVVDDHPIIQDGVADLLNQEADLAVTAKAGTCAQAVRAVKKQPFELALVDMLLKHTTGVQVTRKIKAICPDLIVLIFSMSDEPHYVKQALEAGAKGYILKEELSEKIIDAIRQVLAGKVYLSRRIAKKFLKA
jgi:DNA-binding NarL/FixJ family response regulator